MADDQEQNYWERLAASSPTPLSPQDFSRTKAQLEEVSLLLAYVNYELAYHQEGGKLSSLEEPLLYLQKQPFYHGYETFALVYNSFYFALEGSGSGLKPALVPLLDGDPLLDSITMHLLLVGPLPQKQEEDPLLSSYLTHLVANSPTPQAADLLLKRLYVSIIIAIVRYLAALRHTTLQEELASMGLRLQTVLSQDLPHE